MQLNSCIFYGVGVSSGYGIYHPSGITSTNYYDVFVNNCLFIYIRMSDLDYKNKYLKCLLNNKE